MPGLVKIGMTCRDVDVRCQEIFQTGVPEPFVVYDSAFSPDCAQLERKLHDRYEGRRVHESREFFRISASDASDILRAELKEQVLEWLEDFIPDHAIVHWDLFVDDGDICALAHDLNEPAPIVAQAMMTVTPEEIAPAIDRVKRRKFIVSQGSKE